jgi:3-oxoacyl-[acyl-carrier protein] reductase
MQISFKGKRVVVAGAAGESAARSHWRSRRGRGGPICARGPAALDKTSAEIMGRGVKAHAGVCDLADKGAIAVYIAAAADSLGGIDVLVNNASGFGGTDDEASWARSIDIDVMATVRASHAAIHSSKGRRRCHSEHLLDLGLSRGTAAGTPMRP